VLSGKTGWKRVWTGLVVLAVAGALVESIDALSWVRWDRLMDRVATDPASACKAVTETPLLSFPVASELARTIEAGALLQDAGDCGREALARAAESLRRWAPVDSVGWTMGVRAVLAANKIEEGTRLLKEALKRNPTSPYLHRLMALLDLRSGDYEKALEHLADAEGLAPGYHVPPVEVLPGDDLWVKLEGLRRRAVHYPRQREKTLLSLAQTLWSQGRREEAQQVLEPLQDRPAVMLTRAQWAIEEGRADEAEHLARGVAANVMYPRKTRSRGYSMLARALEAEGKTDRALEVARRAIELDPKSPDPYVALARLARRRGDMKAALQYMRSAWGVAPSNVRVLLGVAYAAEAAGELSDARLALERAEKLAPDRADIGARLAEFLLRHGEYMKAAMVLSRQLERHPMEPRLIALAARLQGKTRVRR